MRSRAALVTSVGLAALAVAGAAAAQDGDDDAETLADDRRAGVDEIVVTATRRAQSIQDVPVAVTVVTGDTLEDNYLSDLTALQRLAPTLTIGEGSSTGTSAIALRGVGTSVFDLQVEPTISVVVDGVVLSRNGQGFTDLIDVERVEVLKGPQGTLFGKNASGGVVNIVTRRPSDEFSAEVEGLVGELGERQLRATVSGPLGGGVGARLTGFAKTIDGNVENAFGGDTLNGAESWGLRGKLEWQPADALNLYLIADYREASLDASEETLRVSGQDGITAVLAAQGVTPGPDNLGASTFVRPFEEITDYGASLQADYELEGATLTSQTAYRRFESDNRDDVDALANDPDAVGRGLVTNSVLTPFAGVALAGPVDIVQETSFALDQVTQEVRLTSDPGEFEWVAGLFGSWVEIDNDFTRRSDVCVAPLGVAPVPLQAGAPCVPNTFVPVAPGVAVPDIVPLSDLVASTGGPSTTGRVVSDGETRNYAAFGEGTLELTERFGVLAGLRVQHDEVEVRAVQADPTSALALSPDPFEIEGEEEQTALSGRAGLQYDLGDDLIYATYSRGYKGPTLDFDPAGNQTEVDEETSDGFEVGFKSRLLDDRLQLNLAAFHVTYDDLQEEAFDPTNGFFILQNVGSVRTRGLEADFVAEPGGGFLLSGGLALVDAEIEEFTNGPCYVPVTEDPGCDPLTQTKDLSGETLPNAPDVKGNLTLDYEEALAFAPDLRFGFRTTVSYQSEVNFSLAQDPNTVQEGYALVDGSVRLLGGDGRWQASLFVRNLLDETYTVSQFQDFTSFGTAQTFQRIPLNAERRFGAALRFVY